MKTIKIKITKKGGWYADQVGKEFDVTEKNISFWQVVGEKDCFISKCHSKKVL